MRLNQRAIASAILLCLGVLAGAAGAADLQPRPELAGPWTIDDEVSDNAGRSVNRALGDVARELRPPNRRGRGPSQSTRQRAAARGELARDVFGPLRLPGRSLRIDVEPDAVVFARTESLHGAGVATEAPEGGRFPALPRLRETERIFTDGRASVVDADNPDVRLGAWEDGVLWIERNGARGTRVVESWALDGDALRIDYEVRNTLLEEPLRFTLSYRRPVATTPGESEP